MKQSKKNENFKLLIPLMIILCTGIFFILWSDNNPTSIDTKIAETTTVAYSSNSCIPANLPVDLTIDLLNEPQAAGDVAFFEVKFTSRIDHDNLKAYLVLPDGAIRESGDDEWEGKLGLNESNQIDAGIRLNTEDAISLQAVVEISRGDTSFFVKKAFNLDLGDKEHAGISELLVSGYAGADSLNLIVPAGN
jgi:hypothetical protein